MSQSTSVSTVIFDFGNVIGFFDYMKVCDRLGALGGISGKEAYDRATNAGFGDLLKQYESGRLTTAEFAQIVFDMIGVSATLEQFEAVWADMFWPNEPVIELALELKNQGYRLFLGSTTNEIHYRHYRSQFAHVLDQFDDYIVSHEVGEVKPHRLFFETCVQRAQLPAHQCLFIDDILENVEGARSIGMHAIHYQNIQQLRDDASKILVVRS